MRLHGTHSRPSFALNEFGADRSSSVRGGKRTFGMKGLDEIEGDEGWLGGNERSAPAGDDACASRRARRSRTASGQLRARTREEVSLQS
mmetsp:Transcript_17919/g.46376  ORF Transcript_17919/g.46376 Transcript_17919/m.46376 type:complete len:89 (-) Transcript_17919:678-944(-)